MIKNKILKIKKSYFILIISLFFAFTMPFTYFLFRSSVNTQERISIAEMLKDITQEGNTKEKICLKWRGEVAEMLMRSRVEGKPLSSVMNNFIIDKPSDGISVAEKREIDAIISFFRLVALDAYDDPVSSFPDNQIRDFRAKHASECYRYEI